MNVTKQASLSEKTLKAEELYDKIRSGDFCDTKRSDLPPACKKKADSFFGTGQGWMVTINNVEITSELKVDALLDSLRKSKQDCGQDEAAKRVLVIFCDCRIYNLSLGGHENSDGPVAEILFSGTDFCTRIERVTLGQSTHKAQPPTIHYANCIFGSISPWHNAAISFGENVTIEELKHSPENPTIENAKLAIISVAEFTKNTPVFLSSVTLFYSRDLIKKYTHPHRSVCLWIWHGTSADTAVEQKCAGLENTYKYLLSRPDLQAWREPLLRYYHFFRARGTRPYRFLHGIHGGLYNIACPLLWSAILFIFTAICVCANSPGYSLPAILRTVLLPGRIFPEFLLAEMPGWPWGLGGCWPMGILNAVIRVIGTVTYAIGAYFLYAAGSAIRRRFTFSRP